jgi:hypothetical protein
MDQLPASITLDIALLAVFLSFITALKYAIPSNFVRTRLIMTSFFCFIVLTLSISFWHYAMATLPYTVPAWAVGLLLGYALGVTTERQKLASQGVQYYMEHFAHIHFSDIKNLTWWSVVNFYSVMGGLLLINLVGLSTVIFKDVEPLAIATCVVGAFLLGTILPYLAHLWTISAER